MAKSIARQYRWSPMVIGDLYFDDLDYLGLRYWYNDAKEIEESLKKK
jgi:hypothetical protein